MKLFFCFSLFLCLIANPMIAQKNTTGISQAEKEYKERITKPKLNGVYIPKNLEDAFKELTRLTTSEARMKFKVMSEIDAKRKLHFGLGRWIRHNWGFWEGSRFSAYLSSLGFKSPDDMSQFLIVVYHRHLNKKSLDIKGYMMNYKKELEERARKKRKRSNKF